MMSFSQYSIEQIVETGLKLQKSQCSSVLELKSLNKKRLLNGMTRALSNIRVNRGISYGVLRHIAHF